MDVAVGYSRASTDEQHLSPRAQRDALERWCRTQKKVLVSVHDDLGVSGGAPLDRRPGLLAALADLRERRAGVLLVAKRDRLARDVVIAATIERLVEREGARVMAADGTSNDATPEGALLRGILDLFGAHERTLIRARTRAALAVKKGRGERVGAPPYGQRVGADGVHLEPDEHEQAALAEIDRLRAEGLSVRLIAAQLNASALRPRGFRWHPTTVARLVRRRQSG